MENPEGERENREGVCFLSFFKFLWNFKSLCQISEQGATFLICGKTKKGSVITQEGDESLCTQTGTAKYARSKTRSEGSTASQSKNKHDEVTDFVRFKTEVVYSVNRLGYQISNSPTGIK